MLLINAHLIDSWTQGTIEPDCRVRIDGQTIASIGRELVAEPGERVFDCAGALVAPGFVCGHTHLYSVLSRGMPATDPVPPKNFREILQKVWWKLDRALDEESMRASARVGMIEAIRAGTTGLIDHHASPLWIDGSLDLIAEQCEDIGVRGLLCYEASDRDGTAIRDAGLAENRRFAERNGSSPWFAGMCGGHASFTMDDATLDACASIVQDCDTGLHVHLAEGDTDRAETQVRYGADLLERFTSRGLLSDKAIFAHCVDLEERELETLNRQGVRLAHNPSSNLNNRVGFAPLWARSAQVLLGTDGIGADMYREAKMAWFRGMEAHPGCSPGAVLAMLENAAATLYSHLGLVGGRIAAGQAADLQILRYRCPTAIDAGNLGGHFLFGMSAAVVESVIVGGRLVLDHGALPGIDEEAEYARARQATPALWRRMLAL